MSNQEYGEDEINLRNYIMVMLKRKKLILAVFFGTLITAAIASLLMPGVYQATASIMILPSRMRTALSPREISLDISGLSLSLLCRKNL